MKRVLPARFTDRIPPTPFLPPGVNALGHHPARHDEWLPEAVAGWPSVACVCLMLAPPITVASSSPYLAPGTIA